MDVLRDVVIVGVPLMIEDLQQLPAAEFERRRRMCVRLMESWVAERIADPDAFPPEQVSRALDRYCEAIAHCAFAPGGVTAHGQHWEARHPEAVTVELKGAEHARFN